MVAVARRVISLVEGTQTSNVTARSNARRVLDSSGDKGENPGTRALPNR
jgi:hypothetical protein